jgi:amino acid transporter
LGVGVGLAVFSSDALSSVAYATQEMLVILLVAGAASFYLSIPISIFIACLLAILTISYRQTIFAYPNGGGAYIVARDNLGETAAQTAGAALLMDYILTVAVSISSGSDQIVSVFPQFRPYQVHICIALITFMAVVNLRGVKESGFAFAIPTYFFVGTCSLTIVVGFYKWFAGTLGQVEGVEMAATTAQSLSLFLILRAFSSGCTALTGVEAISNGITAFRAPASRNAAKTLVIMSLILGTLFVSITVLAFHIHAQPSEHETVISQLARTIYGGRGFFYTALMAGTTIILVMAANTGYADFPRLCALAAGDGFLPRQLTYKSSRLVFSWGIIFLSAAAITLIVMFQAKTTRLIPLYAIGVFMSFTLSQWGMVVRWSKVGKSLAAGTHALSGDEDKSHHENWRLKQAINFIGAAASFVVMMVIATTKFTHGAWITLIIIPLCVWLFFRIHSHYQSVSRFLSSPFKREDVLAYPDMKTVILIDDVNTGTLRMVKFAKTLGHPWTAVHVNFDLARAELVQKKWNDLVGEGELKLIHSPFRLLFEPIIKYLKREKEKHPNGIIHVITGQLVVESPVHSLLHSKNARGLFDEMQKLDRVIVTGVPIHLDRERRRNHQLRAAHGK